MPPKSKRPGGKPMPKKIPQPKPQAKASNNNNNNNINNQAGGGAAAASSTSAMPSSPPASRGPRRCAAPSCQAVVEISLGACPYCRQTHFCDAHRLPERHGCGDAIKAESLLQAHRDGSAAAAAVREREKAELRKQFAAKRAQLQARGKK